MEYTHNEQAVFALLKTALWGQDRCPLEYYEDVDWSAVHQELRDQAVAALAVDLAGEIPEMDDQVKRVWMQKSMRSMAFWQKLMREQDRLKSLMEAEGIPFVVLKGAAAAMYYPLPDRRAMGDVDIIVRPEDFDRASRVMAEDGYELLEIENDRHLEYKKNGILFELHRYFSVMADQDVAKWLDNRIYDGILQAQTAGLDRYSVPVLPTVDNGLVLLTHINQHLEAGLGLRQIVDWMLYVDRELEDARWQAEFGEKAERLGLKTLAVTVTRMCQLCLGLREDGISWCAGADEDLCHELMRFTLNRGNFGRKTGSEASRVRLMSVLSNLTAIPKLLQKHGCINWTALKKYPFLKPFAWIYQLCRYIKKGFEREQPFSTLWREIRQSGRQDNLLNRLEVTRRMKKDFEKEST